CGRNAVFFRKTELSEFLCPDGFSSLHQTGSVNRGGGAVLRSLVLVVYRGQNGGEQRIPAYGRVCLLAGTGATSQLRRNDQTHVRRFHPGVRHNGHCSRAHSASSVGG